MSALDQVPWRPCLLEQLDHSIAVGERFGLLVFNLQRFREVNVEFGPVTGDLVLAAVAERVQGVLRPNDRLFRIGGDEFAVLLSGLKSSQLAELAARRVLEVVAGRLDVQGNPLSLTAHAGAAIYPDDGGTRELLLQAADTALNAARCAGDAYRLYDAGLRQEGESRADIKSKLKVALDNNDLMLHFQPQINVRQGTLGGCEALVRWNHQDIGWISPELFIPVAEGSELIDSLTYWSVNVALKEWFQHCQACAATVPVSVNLSARLLHSPEVVDLVERALNIWGASPGSLVMEVTESAMMADPKLALRTLSALNELGVTISIDDFGTGYSSLAYLKKLPVGELKIDKSFVQHMAEDAMDRRIVQSVIDLAHNLDLKVVAEGIENQASLDLLKSMGCDYAQGYLIAKPMPLADMPGWLQSSRWDLPESAGEVCSDDKCDATAPRVAESLKPA